MAGVSGLSLISKPDATLESDDHEASQHTASGAPFVLKPLVIHQYEAGKK
jgi:hypothetical protein